MFFQNPLYFTNSIPNVFILFLFFLGGVMIGGAATLQHQWASCITSICTMQLIF